jgi:cytochrome P450
MNNLSFNPFDATQAHRIWDVVHRFQREAPVARIGDGFVLVTRYDDVCHVLRNHGVFTNAGNFRLTGTQVPLEDRALGELDAPQHAPLRRIAINAVPNLSVEAMRPFTRAVSQELLGAIVERGRGDLVGRFSVLLTNRVVAKMLGVPLDRGDWLAEQAEEVMKSELPVTNRTARGVGYAGAFPEFTAFIDDLVAARMAAADPGDDAVGRIIRAGGASGEAPATVARHILTQLLLGGTATTRDLLGNLFHRLIQRPDLHAAIDVDRAQIPVAVEEALRLDPPVLFTFRGCAEKTVLGGVELAPGERIVVAIAAANRDEEKYEDPDSFRLDRVSPVPHLTFGYSAHFCVGSALARMETQIALEVFLDKVKPGELRMEPGFQMHHMPTPFLWGPVSLDVERVPGRSST